MRASQERRSLAGKIAVITREHGPDAAELAELRQQLDQLRARELYAWSLSVLTELPSHGEVTEAAVRARRLQRTMTRPVNSGAA